MAEYRRVSGVELRPGVRVFCTDREEQVWDFEGTIVDVTGDGVYLVEFEGLTWTLFEFQISPTMEEVNSDAAKAWRAERALRVFLCHGSEDKEAVRRLYESVKGWGFRPWLDEQEIVPGVEWDVAIRDAIRESHVVLVCLSKTSIEKTGYVQKEIRFVLDRADEMPEGRIYLIPVRLEDCVVPKRLIKWQWVDLYTAGGHERLRRALAESAKGLRSR